MSEDTGAAEPPPIDPRELRNALGMFATGVTIVTTVSGDGRPIGLTCNSFSSVSLKPPLILWSLSLYSPRLQAFLQAPYVAVNILAAEQEALSRRFSTPMADRFAELDWSAGEGGIPLIKGSAAQLECRNETRHYSGDHVVLIGQVLKFSYRDAEPLVFVRGRYRELADPYSG
jgi:flavin reductase (DIM6/NTAB) family NADH-FMN oxidoreductase RutF